MKKLAVGIIAHVDAGKTTLSEAMLYLSGKIRKPGRVDKKNVFLDTHELEQERGITIFSEQARLEWGQTAITLLDTPGHVDFSAEMERTLQVLDYALLVISGADGVQAHTKTLWRLLALYKRPVFIFINKMDQPGANRKALLAELKDQLGEGCLNFSRQDEVFFEELALSEQKMMDAWVKTGTVSPGLIREAIASRKVFPCFFGSALRQTGVEELLQGFVDYTVEPVYPEEFGLQVFKISRNEQGNRLAHLKVVGGTLKVKEALSGPDGQEKVDQIRLYSGTKFTVVNEAEAGTICAVTGLSRIRPGEGLGIGAAAPPVLEPVLAYQVLSTEGIEARELLPRLQEIEEEQPELRIVWDEHLQEIQVRLMGEIQMQILQSLMAARFGMGIHFGEGKILYKETISQAVEGVGHFEPLRHYAEVHLLLEPGKSGSGLHLAARCPEDVLAKTWQRLVLSYLGEKTHLGVLTGSPLTDVLITLVGGKANEEISHGSDFRAAAYRAVRQGLKEAKSRLLEPYYAFELEIPQEVMGRALTDLGLMQADYEIVKTTPQVALLSGVAPVLKMRHYLQEVRAYSKGRGQLFCTSAGYRPCHNQEEAVLGIGYDSERDLENPTGSIFFARGAGFHVSWDQVKEYRHVQSLLPKKNEEEKRPVIRRFRFDDEEIDYALLRRTTSGNWGKKRRWKRSVAKENGQKEKQAAGILRPKEDYLVIDGYNIIHSWPELKEFAHEHLDLARSKLLNILASYQETKKGKILVVFDAYRVPGKVERTLNYPNLQVVFTKEGQTADGYIEKFAYEHEGEYRIRVATSDALQQIITRGAGCTMLSAAELKEEVKQALERALRPYQ